jgi:hypothetical protein
MGMDGFGDFIEKSIKTAVWTGVTLVVLAGGVAYFSGRNSYSKKETINKMEWLADHNSIYGNKNGKFDLEEKLGIIKDIKATYKPDQKISLADAKKYLSLYDNCNITLNK